ncbi:MAG: hypothetical protein V1870_03680 [Candidatus Aenigmatarchaeota archaeon]
MRKIKHMEKVLDFFEKSPVVSIRDIRMIIKDPSYTRLLLFNLIKSKKIYQITRGVYTKHDDPSLTVFCFKPAYIGLQDALSIHNLWDQETNTIIITTKKVRTGLRKVIDNNVIIHRLNKKYIFGYELIKSGNFYLPVSNKEKTLIDLFYFNEIPDKTILKAIKKELDIKKLNDYLRFYPEKFRNRVLKEL